MRLSYHLNMRESDLYDDEGERIPKIRSVEWAVDASGTADLTYRTADGTSHRSSGVPAEILINTPDGRISLTSDGTGPATTVKREDGSIVRGLAGVLLKGSVSRDIGATELVMRWHANLREPQASGDAR